MTDRELLELAAKAAGYDVTIKEVGGCLVGERTVGSLGFIFWRPLQEDGDALRLAVALRINIWLEKTLTIVEVCSDSDAPNIIKKEYCDAETQMAATRRAIVRAAAEIGRNMLSSNP